MKLIIEIPDEDYKYICKIAKDLKGRAVLPTDWKAIANGTPYNPTGDCISREALKEAIDKLFESGGYDSGLVMNTIDNAPTVSVDEEIERQREELYQSSKRLFDTARMLGVERRQGECRTCRHRDPEDKKCDCGALERQGCSFPVSDDYFCKYYEKGGAE